MEIIQSLWTKPFYQNNSNRFNGGWPSEKYNFVSWALSALLLRKHYEAVTLVTDHAGYHLLIEKLKLPYTKVHVTMDAIASYPASLWAIGKIYAYAQQEKPFLHVDGDVFLWNRLSIKAMNSQLLCQNLEVNVPLYALAFDLIETHCFAITDEFFHRPEMIQACNAGILGGSVGVIWQKLYETAFDFIDRNLSTIHSLENCSVLNILLEQYLVYEIAMKHKVVPAVLFNISSEHEILVPASMEKAYYGMSYNHMLGTAKTQFAKLKIMERMLQLMFPKYYYRILKLVDILR